MKGTVAASRPTFLPFLAVALPPPPEHDWVVDPSPGAPGMGSDPGLANPCLVSHTPALPAMVSHSDWFVDRQVTQARQGRPDFGPTVGLNGNRSSRMYQGTNGRKGKRE